MSNCKKVSRLPPSVSKLLYLKELTLANCASLEELPEDIGRLDSLEVLKPKLCNKLTTFPESIGELRKLRWIQMYQTFSSTACSTRCLRRSVTCRLARHA